MRVSVCQCVVLLRVAVVEDMSSLFEKRDLRNREQMSGSKSTLSLRLEQCPQQLNNPFNEYSKFDGKVRRLRRKIIAPRDLMIGHF